MNKTEVKKNIIKISLVTAMYIAPTNSVNPFEKKKEPQIKIKSLCKNKGSI